MKKLYYGPMVLGLAALALGTQVSNVTTVLAEESTTQQAATSEADQIATKKAALKTKIDNANTVLATLNGMTPSSSALKNSLVYAQHTINNASLATLKKMDSDMDTLLNQVTVNDVKVTFGDKTAVVTNVPLEKGTTTVVKNVPANLAVPTNAKLEISLAQNGVVTTSIVYGHIMGQVGDPKPTVADQTSVTTTKALMETKSSSTSGVAEGDTPAEVSQGDELKAAFRTKVNKIHNYLKNVNGDTPDTSTLQGRVEEAYGDILAKNDKSSLKEIQSYIAEFDDVLNTRADYTINTIKVSIAGKEYTIEHVPFQKKAQTNEIKLPSETGLGSNYFMRVNFFTSDSQYKKVEAFIMEKNQHYTDENGKDQVKDEAWHQDLNPKILEITEEPAGTDVHPNQVHNPGTSTDNTNNDSKTDNKPSDNKPNDNQTEQPETKPTENKTIVAHKTVYVTSPTDDVYLYHEDGTQVKGRALGKNTSWAADKMMTLDGVKYLRVATDEWAKVSDGLEIESLNTTVTTNKQATLFTSTGKQVKSRALAANTPWRTDRSAIINGEKMYRVATNEWVSSADIQ